MIVPLPVDEPDPVQRLQQITRATTEGMRWLAAFIAAPGGDPRIRAWAHFLRGFLAHSDVERVYLWNAEDRPLA